MSILADWANFYVIVGSSSAALTGLMFVVITLVPDAGPTNADDGISAFATPTVVHFCAALFVSAMLAAPWRRLWEPAVIVGVAGACGLWYDAVVFRRARKQTNYVPVFEDWLWHVMLPFVAYAGLTIAGATLIGAPRAALFLMGGGSALLLFIGIHNAWDTVTYMAIQRSRNLPPRDAGPAAPADE